MIMAKRLKVWELAFPTSSSAIVQSLRLGEMHPDLPAVLLTQERNKVRVRGEGRHWDYKERLPLADPYAVADFAKDVLAFHNTSGGVIIVGVTDKYAAHGVSSSTILDKKLLRDKLEKYCGRSLDIFQDSIELPNEAISLAYFRKESTLKFPKRWKVTDRIIAVPICSTRDNIFIETAMRRSGAVATMMSSAFFEAFPMRT